MTEQKHSTTPQTDTNEKMYTGQEITKGIQEELGIDYIHFNFTMPDKLYTEEEYQLFKEYAERLMDFGDQNDTE